MPGLVLKNVSKTYQNGRKVIRDFQMEVRKGEFVILAGRVRKNDSFADDCRLGGYYLRDVND